ncbi:MAG: tetratricopeptide repeat protein [Saprospiraceae bacterium]|nr:tetratricopeptide repeat protein [Saprospiraceae bacterium]
MKSLPLIFALIYITLGNVKAQNQDAFPDFAPNKKDTILPWEMDDSVFTIQRKLFQTASKHLCQGDTIGAISLLEQYVKEFPKNVYIKTVKVRLGQLYTDLGNLSTAETILNSVLETLNNDEGFLFEVQSVGNCPPIIQGLFYPTKTNSNACIALNEIAMKRKNYKKALDYLVLSETKYFPSTECGNGSDMMKMMIEERFIKYFLTIGDTSSAIKRAMENLFISSQSNVILLRQLLLRNHTEKEVFDEVEKAISNVYFVKKSNENRIETPFSLFEYSINNLGRVYFSDVRELRESLKKDRIFQILKTGQ